MDQAVRFASRGNEGGGHPGDAFAAIDLAGQRVVVEELDEAAAEAGPVDDEVDHAVVEEELGGLEALGQFLLGDLFDDARAGETDESAGFGHDDIGDGGVAGGDAAVAGIDQQGDMGDAASPRRAKAATVFAICMRERGLRACGAAGGVDSEEGGAGLGAVFDGAGEFFPETEPMLAPMKPKSATATAMGRPSILPMPVMRDSVSPRFAAGFSTLVS